MGGKDSKPVKATETVGNDPIVLISNEVQTIPLMENDSTAKTAVSRVTINMNSSEFDKNTESVNATEAVRITPVELLSMEVQAMSLVGDDSTESPDVPSSAANPTYFQLLETVSPHVQSVFLEKCTVLELSSLAAVSRSLRKGALATMAKRSLTIYIRLESCWVTSTMFMVVYIVDGSDPSRNERVEFCDCMGDTCCNPWKKIAKLMHFCAFASLQCIYLGYACPILDYPHKSKFKSDHGMSHYSPPFEVSVDEVVATFFGASQLLQFVTPRVLKLEIYGFSSGYDSVFDSRGMILAESIALKFTDPNNSPYIADKKILKLTASSITFYAPVRQIFHELPTIDWTPVGVTIFVEQWLRGSRVIYRVQSMLPMFDESIIDFGQLLLEALEKLDHPPKIDFSTTLDDNLKDRLQILDGKKIYNGEVGFFPYAQVVHLTASDGRQLSIVVTAACTIEQSRLPTSAPFPNGFIDIFPTI